MHICILCVCYVCKTDHELQTWKSCNRQLRIREVTSRQVCIVAVTSIIWLGSHNVVPWYISMSSVVIAIMSFSFYVCSVRILFISCLIVDVVFSMIVHGTMWMCFWMSFTICVLLRACTHHDYLYLSLVLEALSLPVSCYFLLGQTWLYV